MLTTAPARTRVPDGFEPGPLRIGRAVFRYHGGVRARLVILIALSFAVAPLAGCRTRAPAGRYQKDGLSFEHPEGWQVTLTFLLLAAVIALVVARLSGVLDTSRLRALVRTLQSSPEAAEQPPEQQWQPPPAQQWGPPRP